MLFTGKGDDGATKLFACDQRISKSSAIAEALGSVDEINSLLGVVKTKSKDMIAVNGVTFADILDGVQQDMFIVQASLAGADKHVEKNNVEKLEMLVNNIEKELPPISSFFVSGGTELGALCDYARTVARRAERRVVEALRDDTLAMKGVTSENHNEHIVLFAYMNRLSSLLYALARLANHRAGVVEEKPHY